MLSSQATDKDIDSINFSQHVFTFCLVRLDQAACITQCFKTAPHIIHISCDVFLQGYRYVSWYHLLKIGKTYVISNVLRTTMNKVQYHHVCSSSLLSI